jgi:CO/xanthine dehydrogenase Mo-binding subunit
MTLDRRSFVVTSLGGALGLMIGCRTTAEAEAADEATGRKGWLNAWLEIPEAEAEKVTFVMGFTEMGQGTMTGLAMLVAEELDYPLERLTWRMALADRRYDHPDFKFQITGGSASIKSSYDRMRELGAAARDVLVQAAAKRWSLAPDQVTTHAGQLRAPDGRTLAYREVAVAAAALKPRAVKLKKPEDHRVVGKAATRLDAWPEALGAARFGIDVEMPDMLVATIVHAPVLGAAPQAVDDAAARTLPGFKRAIMLPHAVAIVCEKYWQTLPARDAVKIAWKDSPSASFSTAAHQAEVAKLLASPAVEAGKEFGGVGKIADGKKRAKVELDVTYDAPFLAHATLEPQNCTAWYEPREKELHLECPTQAPGLVRAAAAAAIGLPQSRVTLQTTLVGGGFGRRLEADYAIEAALVARELTQPVKVLWSREEDMRNDYYRPCGASRFRGGVDEKGEIAYWDNCLATQDLFEHMGPDFMQGIAQTYLGEGISRFVGGVVGKILKGKISAEGAAEIAYATPAFSMRWQRTTPPVPVGSWRSVGHSMNGFFVESFVDELAHAAKADPVAFRRAHLERAKKTRHLAVLDKVVEMSGWSARGRRAFGVAVHESFAGVCAEVVEVEVKDGVIGVPRVWAAIDPGVAVYPDAIHAQLSGAVVFALTAALYGKITFAGGRAEQESFDTYPLLRINECPRIETAVVATGAPVGGVGEPGVPPLAAALANAVFAATGKRVRSLPFPAKLT